MTTAVLILLALVFIVMIVLLIIQLKTKQDIIGQLEEKSDIDKVMADIKLDIVKELNANSIKNERAFLENFLMLNETMKNEMEKTALSRERIEKQIREGLIDVQTMTDKKLDLISANVNQKLDSSLNERLDENFKQISERLESLYKSLGELKNLESGVISLNKTLSNVKTRGVFGEMQLGNILAEVFDKSQYDENVATKPKSEDFVEYAVKIPDKENHGEYIYLPIDAKFPSDIYNRIVDASFNADPAALETARKDLKNRIRTEAISIRDKYIAPPYTTDFAVMFIPTESLYAEILMIDGLAEYCQNRCKVIITGPMTLTAMLNSLSVGFKYLTVNKKTEEILKTLGAFKTQFEKYDELIIQTQKSLDAAQKKTETVQKRNQMIRKSLRSIDSLTLNDSDRILLIDNEDDDSYRTVE